MKNSNLELLASFNEKCKKNNIWYSLSSISLLKLKNGQDIDFRNIIEVMMDVDDYKKFLSIYSDNILDSSTRNNYYFTNPFYYENRLNGFIKINLFVKASIQKSEKVYSIKNLIRQKLSFYLSINKEIDEFKTKFKKAWYKFLNLFVSPISWQEVYLNICSEKYNGYFVIDSFKKNINENWIPSLTLKRENVLVENVETFIIEEWQNYLIKKFTNKWNEIAIEEFDYDYNLIVSKD